MSFFGAAVKGHRQLIIFVLALLLVCWLAWSLLGVLLPFIVGFILAFQLLPLIRWVERRFPHPDRHPQVKRIATVVVIYLLALALVVLAVFYIISVMGKSLLALAQDAPQMIPNGLAMVKEWLKSIPLLSSAANQARINVVIVQAGESLTGALNGFLTQTVDLVKASSGMILGFAVMPVFTFFVLKDWDKLREGSYAALPSWVRPHARNVLTIVQQVVGRYIRGQLLLALVLGACTGGMLFGLGIDLALPLAVFAGLMEMVPLIGPYFGAGLGILVTLSTAPHKVIWVALGYVVFSLAENNFLVPKIQGSQMEIHPAFIILLTFLGAYFAGVLGFIVVLPLTMTVSRVYGYLRDSVKDGTIS